MSLLHVAVAAKVASEAKKGNRAAMDACEAFAIIFAIIIAAIVIGLGVVSPIIFSIGGFQMISQGMSEAVVGKLGIGGLGAVFSTFVGLTSITCAVIEMVAPAPYAYLERDDYKRYCEERKKFRKASWIAWPIFWLVVALTGLAVYVAYTACIAGNFVLAGIILGILGIFATIEGILGIVGWLLTM